MIPEIFPVFTVNDILTPPSKEYEYGEKRTVIGWLKHLFLYYNPDGNPDLIMIRPEDRKDYEKALDIFCRESKIKASGLHDWEDRHSRKQQCAALNRLRRKIGYVHEFYLQED